MCLASNYKIAVFIFCIAIEDWADKPRFVTHSYLRNLAVYKMQTLLPNIQKLIELVATNPVLRNTDLAERHFHINVEESSEK